MFRENKKYTQVSKNLSIALGYVLRRRISTENTYLPCHNKMGYGYKTR